MSNPLALFDDLREMYLRYLDSPFDLRYPDLVTERRDLLSVDGRIFRQPLIEPIPAYQSSNQTFQAIAQARLGGIWNQAEIDDLAVLYRWNFSRQAGFLTRTRKRCLLNRLLMERTLSSRRAQARGKQSAFSYPLWPHSSANPLHGVFQVNVIRVGIGGTTV